MVYKSIIHSAFLIVITLFISILNILSVNAYFYNIAYTCKDNICVEGDTAIWHVTISNEGKSKVEYTAIEFFDAKNNSQFGYLKIPFEPLSEERGNLIVVGINEKVAINLTGKLPKPNYGQSLVYYPCFTTAITDSYIISRYNVHESRHCYNKNESMLIFQCASNNHCSENEYCTFNKCVKLNCKNCQYIKEHKCTDYECCSSEQCKFNEMCMNNTCKKLDCNFNEYIANHTCQSFNCTNDETIVHETCIKLNCGYDEFALNHTCKKLNCSFNEVISNHTCELLECKENEYAKNHTCNPLKCSYNETILNHGCKALNCYFFQETVNHSCINNVSVFFKSIMEFIVIIVIIIFVIVDFKKVWKKS